jgi:hypothetical protein
MWLRTIVALGAALGAVTAVILPAGSGQVAGASARVGQCNGVLVDGYSVSSGQQGAAGRYWTPARMQSSEGFSLASLARALKSQQARKEMVPLPQPTLACAALPGRGQDQATSVALPASSSQTIIGYPTVGKFFYKVGPLRFNCTGTVINDGKSNPKEELMVTAGHCFHGVLMDFVYTSSDWSFAPMWHNNKAPFGSWSVKHFYMDSNFVHCHDFGIACAQDPRYDYAVVVLAPKNGHGVGHVTGENGWSFPRPETQRVRIVGINGSGKRPLATVTRSTTLKKVDGGTHYLARRASTPGFSDGTSGGPWFYSFNSKTDLGYLLGVIGGFDAGGDSKTSYASFWNANFGSIVASAAKHE